MNFRQRIAARVPNLGRAATAPIQILIVLSLISFSIETLPGLSAESRKLLRYFEIFTISVFTIEYLLRILIAEKPLKYILSFFGLIDLVAIVPFYLTTGLDLRSVRAFRLLRIFRLLKLARYSAAIRRLQHAFSICREELILFACTAAIILYLSAVGIYYFENQLQPDHFTSVLHCLWWAIITLTTVGYGDMIPMSLGGRMFTFIILIVGIGIVAVPTALISSALSTARDDLKDTDHRKD